MSGFRSFYLRTLPHAMVLGAASVYTNACYERSFVPPSRQRRPSSYIQLIDWVSLTITGGVIVGACWPVALPLMIWAAMSEEREKMKRGATTDYNPGGD
jgi:hypothetical protein